jgi:hypothetical protein
VAWKDWYLCFIGVIFEGLMLVTRTSECVVFCAVATHLRENVLPLTGMWCLWSECVGSQNVCVRCLWLIPSAYLEQTSAGPAEVQVCPGVPSNLGAGLGREAIKMQ